jgi:hypothetical protein
MVAITKIKYFSSRVWTIRKEKEVEIAKAFASLPVKDIEIVVAGGGVMRSSKYIRDIAKGLATSCNPKFTVLDIFNLDGEITDNSAANQKISDGREAAIVELRKLATKTLDIVHFGTDEQLHAALTELENWTVVA